MKRTHAFLVLTFITAWLNACGGGGGGGGSAPPVDPPPVPAVQWSAPVELGELPELYRPGVGTVRARASGGAVFDYAGYADAALASRRQAFFQFETTALGIDSPGITPTFAAWTWLDRPSSALGVGTINGQAVVQSWQYFPSAGRSFWLTPVTLDTTGYVGASVAAADARAGGMGMVVLALSSPGSGTATLAVTTSTNATWSTPTVLGASLGEYRMAMGPDDSALLVSNSDFRTYSRAGGWSAPRALPFALPGVNVRPDAVAADAAGNFYLAAVRCAPPAQAATCRPVVARYESATGWGSLEEFGLQGDTGILQMNVSPAGQVIVWSWRPGPFLVPNRAELWAAVRWPGVGWSPATVLAPMQDVFLQQASFVAEDSGRFSGGWNTGLGRVEAAVYTPGPGWGSTRLLQQVPVQYGSAIGNIGAVLDAKGPPTLVWAGPKGTTGDAGFYRSVLR